MLRSAGQINCLPSLKRQGEAVPDDTAGVFLPKLPALTKFFFLPFAGGGVTVK